MPVLQYFHYFSLSEFLRIPHLPTLLQLAWPPAHTLFQAFNTPPHIGPVSPLKIVPSEAKVRHNYSVCTAIQISWQNLVTLYDGTQESQNDGNHISQVGPLGMPRCIYLFINKSFCPLCDSYRLLYSTSKSHLHTFSY